jgi:colicin import membrane protein
MSRKKSIYPFEPPREHGTWRAVGLAVLMHVLLGLFLYRGIQWQNSMPAGAEAELWVDTPNRPLLVPAAPPPPARVSPALPVADDRADIALQEKKRQQQKAAEDAAILEQQRLRRLAEQDAQAKRQLAERQAAQLAVQKAAAEKLKQQQAQADKLKQQQLAEQQKLKQQQLEQQKAAQQAQQKADAEKAAKAKQQAQQQAIKKQLDQERRARIAQMQGMAGGEGSTGNGLAKSGTGSGAGGTATSAGYAEKVQRRVRPNIIWAGDAQGLETVIAVRCSPTGMVLSAEVQRSSGNAQWDDAALNAVKRSTPMPLDTNGRAPSFFTITMRPGP